MLEPLKVQLATDLAQLKMWVLVRTYGLEVPVNWEMPKMKVLPKDEFWPLRVTWT